MRIAWTFALLAVLSLTTAPAANAQFWRAHDLNTLDGEPTDPDGTLAVLEEASLDLDDYGITATEPATEEEAASWWTSIINLLFELGLISGDAD